MGADGPEGCGVGSPPVIFQTLFVVSRRYLGAISRPLCAVAGLLAGCSTSDGVHSRSCAPTKKTKCVSKDAFSEYYVIENAGKRSKCWSAKLAGERRRQIGCEHCERSEAQPGRHWRSGAQIS